MSETIRFTEEWKFNADTSGSCTKRLLDGSVLEHTDYAAGQCPILQMGPQVTSVEFEEIMSRKEFEGRYLK